jgi:phospholipid transport system substrate-binding protein
VLGAALALVAAPGRADDPAPPASPVIEKLHEALLSAMKRADELGFEGRYELLEPVLRNTFDFDFMAEKAVGRHWRELSPEDQKRMRDVFARFTLSTYANRFAGYSGERFEIRSEQPAPRSTVFVRTELVRPKGEEPIEINYRLRRTASGWRIIDVLLRGTVSELALRRSEYSSVIKRDGFEALVTDLEEKIADLASGEGDDSPS